VLEQPIDRRDLALALEQERSAGGSPGDLGGANHHQRRLCHSDQPRSSPARTSVAAAEKISGATTMRSPPPPANLARMTSRTVTRIAPTYALGRSKTEHERLAGQAALLEAGTERLLRDAGLEPGMRVLDVGSGAGDVAFLAAELVGRGGAVVGIDVDGDALDAARRRAELLGLGNVSFVEGDVRSAALEDAFDAVIGRLVLAYVDDPAAALCAIAEHVRPGGVVAFEELDLDAGVHSHSLPEGTLWDETGRRVIETFARAGTQLRMGRRLFAAFLAAGLPAPAMRHEALIGGGPDFAGYAWLAGVAGSLAPLMDKLGVAAADELALDTLAKRLREDAVARGAVVWSPPLIGAYTRRTDG
jgi:ubiquinone/menaquinone biosynthesis C-methylase UbiE